MVFFCPCFSSRSFDEDTDLTYPSARLSRAQSRSSNRRVSFALPRSQSISSNLRVTFFGTPQSSQSRRSSRAPSFTSSTSDHYPRDEKRREDFLESQSIYTHTTSTVSLPSNGFTETTEGTTYNSEIPPPPYSPPRTPSPLPSFCYGEQPHYDYAPSDDDGHPSSSIVRFDLPSSDDEEPTSFHPNPANLHLYRRSLAPSYETINMVSGLASAAVGAIGASTGAAALHYAWQDRRSRQQVEREERDVELGFLPPSPPPTQMQQVQTSSEVEEETRNQEVSIAGADEAATYEHVWTGMR